MYKFNHTSWWWTHPCDQYRNWDPDQAVKDYYKRIQDHEKHYETVEELTWPFIRILNVGYL